MVANQSDSIEQNLILIMQTNISLVDDTALRFWGGDDWTVNSNEKIQWGWK
jgi:hypothetical protein